MTIVLEIFHQRGVLSVAGVSQTSFTGILSLSSLPRDLCLSFVPSSVPDTKIGEYKIYLLSLLLKNVCCFVSFLEY